MSITQLFLNMRFRKLSLPIFICICSTVIILANAGCTGINEEDAMVDAVVKGDFAIVRQITARHPGYVNLIGSGDDYTKSSILETAIINNHKNIALFLINKGADVNYKDSLGCTALHHAATVGNVDVLRALLSKGANVNAADLAGSTPLHEAAALKGPSTVAELLKHKANPNAMSTAGHTPLAYAMMYGRRKTAELLRKNGAKEVIEPLVEAAVYGDLALVKKCIENDPASINRKIGAANEPIMCYAATSGQAGIVQYLLKHGAHLAPGTLENAVNSSSIPTVEQLVKYGVDVNAVGVNSVLRPIQLAADNNDLQMVKYLLSVGANPSLALPDQDTAMDIARKNGNKTIQSILSKYLKSPHSTRQQPTQSP